MSATDRDLDRRARTMSKQAMLGKGPLAFEQVLRDPVNLNYFKKFCIQQLASENLLCWLEIEEYKGIKAPEYRAFVARKIFRKYIEVSLLHSDVRT